MSRFQDYEYDGERTISWEMWQHNVDLALSGQRGRQALTDLREALLALPDHRLISRALCTVGKTADAQPGQWNYQDVADLLAEQGEGVCAVGAYVWWRKVKGGMDPERAFAATPLLPDTDSDQWETAEEGKRAGLRVTLAFHLAHLNDETWAGLLPEQRWTACLEWIDQTLAHPPVSR